MPSTLLSHYLPLLGLPSLIIWRHAIGDEVQWWLFLSWVKTICFKDIDYDISMQYGRKAAALALPSPGPGLSKLLEQEVILKTKNGEKWSQLTPLSLASLHRKKEINIDSSHHSFCKRDLNAVFPFSLFFLLFFLFPCLEERRERWAKCQPLSMISYRSQSITLFLAIISDLSICFSLGFFWAKGMVVGRP